MAFLKSGMSCKDFNRRVRGGFAENAKLKIFPGDLAMSLLMLRLRALPLYGAFRNALAPGCRRFQLLDFSATQSPELAGRNVQIQRAVADSFDLLHVMSDLLEHAADLPVLALDQRDFVPRIFGFADQPNFCGSSLHALPSLLINRDFGATGVLARTPLQPPL